MKLPGRGAAACLVVLAWAITLAAQGQENGRLPLLEPTAGTFKATVDVVTLSVAVMDGKNRPVPGLVRSDFQVFEDGVAQDVSFFATSEVPVDVALLVDASSSINSKMPMIEQAAGGFIDSLGPKDRAAVMAFASQTRVIQGFTGDRQALKTAVGGVAARGSTSLYAAVYIAIDTFQRARRQAAATAGVSSVRRQAIVVLTDGEDTASLISFDDLLDRARRAGIAIYPIAITRDDESFLAQTDARLYFSRADYALKTLALETGARAFFPAQLSDLDGVYRLVSEELSTQYALGYVPKVDRRDGTFRRISVRVATRPDARPRTRTGYYSPGPARASR